MRKLFLIFAFLGINALFAQPLQPVSHQVLNYIQVLFEGQMQQNAAYYHLYVWESDSLGFFSPTEKIAFKRQDSIPLFIVPQLHWGRHYRWLYTADDVLGKPIFVSDTAIFEIAKTEKIWFEKYQFNLLKNTQSRGYILVDGAKCVVNRAGEVQWIMPRYLRWKNKTLKGLIRDLRMTNAGTFTCTFITGECVEFDKTGKILWIAPNTGEISKDTSELYHHDFRKLPNGNYMALGQSSRKMALPKNIPLEAYKGAESITIQGDTAYCTALFGNVIEYDAAGKVVWFWESRPYFRALYEKGLKAGSTHLNAFVQDSAGKYIYLSFRDLNMIAKLDKEKKEVVATFGRSLYAANEDRGNDLFVGQHGIELGKNGELITFDNESKTQKPSTALILSQPLLSHENTQILSGFSCKVDSLDDGKTSRSGSAEMLENGNILIGMGGLGRIVEQRVADSVRIWEMRCMHFDTVQKKILPLPNYRCHFAPSMYPYLYRVVEKGAQHITIYNRGEMPDSYEIESQRATGEKISLLKSPVIVAGHSYTQMIRKGAAVVRIRSVHHPESIIVLKREAKP